MKIERYDGQKRQNSSWLLGCGCAGVGAIVLIGAVVATFIIFPTLTNRLLQTVGVQRVGTTSEIFSASVPTVSALMDTRTVGEVTLMTGQYSQTLSGSGEGYTVVIGDTETGMQPQMQITFTEEGLLTQCRILTTICDARGDVIRNADFDLRRGGMIINGEFQLPTGQWQTAGLVVRFRENNQFEIVGIDVGNQVFAATAPEYASLVQEAESRGNLFISALTARSGIEQFSLSDIRIDDTTATLILS